MWGWLQDSIATCIGLYRKNDIAIKSEASDSLNVGA